MLKLYTSMDPVPVNTRVAIMKHHIEKGGVPLDYDRMAEHLAYNKIRASRLHDVLAKDIPFKGKKITDTDVLKWLYSNGITQGLTTTDKGALSLGVPSLESFLNTNAYNDEVNTIVKRLKTLKECLGIVLQIPAVLKDYDPMLETEDGRRLILAKPNVVRQNTGRFGFNNPGLLNWPAILKDCRKAPAGFELFSADSSQIEPMLIYNKFLKDPQISKLISVYGDAYYAVLHYCLMDEDLIRRKVMDFVPNEITDDMKDGRKRIKTYGNAVMYGSTGNPEKDPIKDAFIKRIGQHPARKAWQEELDAKLLSGQRHFETIFGTLINVYESAKYLESRTPEDKARALSHCVINNPIQGSAADCAGFSLQASDKLMKKSAPNSWIAVFTHDEGTYCVYKEEMGIFEELKGHTSYSIDDEFVIKNDYTEYKGYYDDVPTFYKKREDSLGKV